jgi:hypothetical protein
VANAAQAVGSEAVITRARGVEILSIDGAPALEFIESQMGKPMYKLDRGNICLRINDSSSPREKRLRAIDSFSGSAEGAVSLFGGIEEGERVQLCLTDPDKMLRNVRDIGAGIKDLDFKPAAGIIVSCAGRKQLLATRVEGEVQAVTSPEGGLSSLVGFTSFGEFGSVLLDGEYSRPLFHNMTYVLLVLD